MIRQARGDKMKQQARGDKMKQQARGDKMKQQARGDETRASAGQGGFTLLEILIATAIFAASIVAIIAIGKGSVRAVRESQSLFKAVQLAQLKMNELEYKYQKQIDRDGIKEGTLAEENGSFEAPFDDYKWDAKLTESQMKLNEASLKALLKSFGVEDDAINEQLENPAQRIVFSNINKAIKENYVELVVNVRWERFGRKYMMPLVTHMVPTKPKITLTQSTDDFEKGDSVAGGSDAAGGSEAAAGANENAPAEGGASGGEPPKEGGDASPGEGEAAPGGR